jgi:RNA polymerase sigma factor (sigma-70 family)
VGSLRTATCRAPDADEELRLTQRHDATPAIPAGQRLDHRPDDPVMHRSFDDRFVALFDEHYPRLLRYLDRLSQDPDVAADVAQDAFVRLYQRGSVPDMPGAWLVSVAMNLFRNVRTTRSRRLRLLTKARVAYAQADPAPAPDAGVEARETRARVRLALDRIPDRERRMLLLRAEGYSYREIAVALDVNERSVGTLLARAARTFSEGYGEGDDAPR